MTPTYQKMFKKIVLVEDDPVALRLLEGILSQADFLVRSARDGQTGFDLVRKERPDLVVSDVVLPRLDGLGLCARIKDDPDLASTKVVLTTAVYKNVTLKQVMRDSKADAVIEKPIDSAGFLKKVRGLLA
ncbi:MAG: response regulator [Candidatus Aminicenantes bacterium]|nr:response regulator [Candidatus Aminicenantes bacterium]